MQAVKYLRTHSNAGDEIFVWGREAIINYIAELGSPSRFVFSLPLTKPGPFLNQYRSEALDALKTKKPRFIIIGTPYFPHGRDEQIDEKISIYKPFS